ncbi:hypothetical protein BTVI_126159 [Pitangus sulphuratus]|nr:hypothetical protein BTVI_126159 [Pitangus sulphuratus]
MEIVAFQGETYLQYVSNESEARSEQNKMLHIISFPMILSGFANTHPKREFALSPFAVTCLAFSCSNKMKNPLENSAELWLPCKDTNKLFSSAEWNCTFLKEMLKEEGLKK